jgi:hypothetical protein
VSLNAVPWAQLEIDGRALGNTPLRELELGVGRHAIRAVHPPEQLTRVFEIEVAAETAQAFLLDLRRGTVTRRVVTP